MYRFLVATAGPDEADDCFQETWIAALRAYPRLRRADNLRGWLLKIAQRKAIDAHRARGRRAVPVGERARAGRAAEPAARRRRARAVGRAARAPAQAAHRRVLPLGARDALRGAGRRCWIRSEEAARAQRARGPEAPERGVDAHERRHRDARCGAAARRRSAEAAGAEPSARRRARRAEGLLDVAYAVGRLAPRSADRGGHAARAGRAWPTRRARATRCWRTWRRKLSPRVLEAPARLDRGPPRAGRVLRGQARAASTCRSTGRSRTASPAGAASTPRGSRTASSSTYADVAARRRQPARGARRRQRAGRQPDAGRRALPPGACAPAGRSAATPAGSSARSSCCGWRACWSEVRAARLPSASFRRGGRVAEGTRLLSE